MSEGWWEQPSDYVLEGMLEAESETRLGQKLEQMSVRMLELEWEKQLEIKSVPA